MSEDGERGREGVEKDTSRRSGQQVYVWAVGARSSGWATEMIPAEA